MSNPNERTKHLNAAAREVTPVGLTYMSYRLPHERLAVDEAACRGLLHSGAPFLRDVGFGHCFIESDRSVFEEMVAECGEDLLTASGLPREDVRWLFRCSGLSNELAADRCDDDPVLAQFRYPVGSCQDRLDLHRASSIAISQQGCSGLLSSIHLAQRLLQDDETSAVMCLAGDCLPAGSRREILFNLMSDAAGAVLVERNARKNRILHFVQHTMPYYWDTPRRTTEMLASYFPLAQRLIRRALNEAGLHMDDVAWIVPHNVSLRSWSILADLLGVCPSRVWADNIARIGHTISCDHIINLYDMEQQGFLRSGDVLLLFTFGFGATWTCLLIEH